MEKDESIHCLYCDFYQQSTTRIQEQRFCNHVQRMISKDDPICDENGFEACSLFWCDKSDHWIDLRVCSARQAKDVPECTHCKQKAEILEVRKFMGRKNGGAKKLIVKKTIEVDLQKTEDDLKALQKEAMNRNEVIVTATQQKPKIILHKKTAVNTDDKHSETTLENSGCQVIKQKIVLHKRVKETDVPTKKKIIKKNEE